MVHIIIVACETKFAIRVFSVFKTLGNEYIKALFDRNLRHLIGSLNGFADVPNPCFWRVVEYAWLGDWRHP